MAFPTTSVLDNFNRSNGAVGSNWTSLFTSSGLTITSNQVGNSGATGAGEMYWNPSTFGPDMEVYATWATVSASSALILWIIVGTPTIDVPNGYIVEFDQGSTTATVSKVTSGSASALSGTTITITAPAAGHRFGFERIGNTFTVYQDTGGGFASKGTRSDSTFTGTGRVGMSTVATGDRVDDFSGGTVVSAIVNYGGFPSDHMMLQRARTVMPAWRGPRVESVYRISDAIGR